MPSQESVGSSSSRFDSEPKRSRIHFPVDETNPSLRIYRAIDEEAPRPLPLGTKTSPARRNSPLSPYTTSTSRRRVRSVGTPADVFQGSSLNHRQFDNVGFTPPRATGSHLLERGSELMDNDDVEHNPFSDEYDLAHEDPKILQDVQRALKLKARREARLSNQATPPRSHSNSSRAQRAISLTMQSMSPVLPNSQKEILSSDIDFSPSTGKALLHPVPVSLDNGLTLDWSGFDDKPESRWKLTGMKRKGKEVFPPAVSVRKQQETAYADKLGRLKSIASPQTIQKVKMTQDQLGRRYKLIFGILSTGKSPDIAKVARWYGQQDASTQNALEKAEPFTWLKHLENRNTSRPSDRPPWHISALIAEEYLRIGNHHDSMTTIPEDSPIREGPDESPMSSPFTDSQLAPVTSRDSSNHILGPSLVRNLPLEDGLTFGTRVNSTHNSLEADTRRSHESSFSSLPIGLSSNVSASPSSGRGRPHDGPSQPIPVISLDLSKDQPSEHLHSEEPDHGELRNQRSPVTRPDASIRIISASDGSEEVVTRGAGTTQFTTPSPSDTDLPKLQTVRPSARSRPAVSGRRRARVSFPSADRTSKSSEVQQEADEQKAYEAKVRLLEQTTATNHRIRQLLNRVSGDIREYDGVQSNVMASLGIAHIGLPRDLIDAFGHDPAGVAGSTRRFQGWRAVDDIQNRLIRQREVFRAFLSRTQNQLPRTKSILDDPISSLMQSLKALELHSQRLAGRAFEVGEALKSVQAMHDAVKADYNKTLARTSVVYPELSHIVVLEESYKDQYQQFWEFGMDTLTFILDTVTPFWRTYGKTIGEDVRDFLIIPLYRNEFTGESKRYPITRMPIRSPRHWLGLVIFFFASVAVAILQVRAALSSSALYKLPMITYESIRWTALPFFWLSILIQWWAVVIEFIVVFLQLGVVAWWAGWSVRLFT